MKTKPVDAPVTRKDSSSACYKIGATTDELETIRSLLLPSKVEVIPLKGNALAIEVMVDGAAVAANTLPNNLIGFVALSKKSHAILEDISMHWEMHGHKLAPSCFLLEEQKNESLLNPWIIDQIIKANRDTAIRNVDLMRELTKIRIAHEETQRAFYALERYAETNFDLKRQQALALEPSTDMVQLNQDRRTVTQLVPTVSVGVCDIAIHIASAPTETTGRLDITLTAVESGKRVSSWTVPGISLQKSWIQLSLPRSLGVDEESLSLTVEWVGAGSISLSMACSHPDPKWCAIAKGAPLSRTLAMKVWRGLPHTAPTQASNAYDLTNVPTKRWLVDEGIMRNAENLSHMQEAVQYIEALGAVLVHPIDSKAVLARLSGSAPKGALHVWADVESGNKAAGPIEFAIAVASPLKGRGKTETIKFKPGYISEWITLPGGAKSEVHLFLPQALDNAEDIYLATRIKQGNSNENCWAYFKKIRATA
jgi:hypothetical protein